MIGRFHHIEQVKDRCGGAPVIVGTRLTVETVVAFIKGGEPEAELIKDYPYLNSEIIRECLAWEAAGMPLR